MSEGLDIVNRFIEIIVGGQSKNDRLQTEWEYLYKLLKSDPIAYDRIDAYLNILQQQDTSQKKALNRTKNSQTNHPQTKKYIALINSLDFLFTENDEKIVNYKKNELGF